MGKADNNGVVELTRRDFFRILRQATQVSLAGLITGLVISDQTSVFRKNEGLEFSLKVDQDFRTLVTFPYRTEALDQSEVFDRLKKSIVIVQDGLDYELKARLSTGVLIGNYVLCTFQGIGNTANSHQTIDDIINARREYYSNVQNHELVRHGFDSGFRDAYQFRIVYFDRENDLALLHLPALPDKSKASPAKTKGTPEALYPGREILALGVDSLARIYDRFGKITGVSKSIRITDKKVEEIFRVYADIYVGGGLPGGIIADPNGSFLGIGQAFQPVRVAEDGEYLIGAGWDILRKFLEKAAMTDDKRLEPYLKLTK